MPELKPSWRSAVRGNVLMMGLVSLFTDFSSEMMNPLLPVFIAGLVPLALAPVYLGLMDGLAETTASLLKIYSGRISDRLGKRKGLVILGYGLSAAARPLMATAGLLAAATAGVQIIVLKFLDRVGKGIRTSPRDALIGDSVPSQFRGLAFSFHRAMDHTGAVLGPVVAIPILMGFMGSSLWTQPAGSSNSPPSPQQIHWLRWLFAIAIIPGIAAMAALVLKVRDIAPSKTQASKGVADGRARLPRRFYLFVAIVTIFALGNSSDLFIVFLASRQFSMSLGELLVLWIVFHASKIVFSIPGGILSDKLGRRPVIVAGWIVYALVYLGLALATAAWQFWALVLVYGFYYGMSEGVEKALVTDFSPSESRGTAFGLYYGAVGIAATPASLIFGLFWAQVGPRVAFGLGAALAGLAAVLLIVLLSTTKKKEPSIHGA